MIGDDETNFPHKLLLTNRQVANLCKVFANYLSTGIKLSKAQLSKMIQSGGFLGWLLGPLLKAGLPLIKNVIKALAKSLLIPLELTAAASAADAWIHKNILGSGHNHPSPTTLIISNNEMGDIIKLVKSLEDSGLLLKGVTETVQNEVKEQKGGFLSMLLGTLGANLLGNILAGKGATATRQGRGINIAGKGRGIRRAGEETVRSGYGNKKGKEKQQNGFLMLPLPLTNFEMQKYYQNKPRFNGAYSRDNLSKIKDGAYVINLDEYSDIGTHWVVLYVHNDNVTYFESSGVEHIPKEIKHLLIVLYL